MPCAVFVWEVVLRDGLVWSDVPKSMWDFKENFIVSRGSWGVGACMVPIWCYLLDAMA
jgi:hypothetical protein